MGVGKITILEVGVAVGEAGVGVLVTVATVVGIGLSVWVAVGVGVAAGIEVGAEVWVGLAVGLAVGTGAEQSREVVVAVTDLSLRDQVTLDMNFTRSVVWPDAIELKPNLSSSKGPLLGKWVPWPQFLPVEEQSKPPEN